MSAFVDVQLRFGGEALPILKPRLVSSASSRADLHEARRVLCAVLQSRLGSAVGYVSAATASNIAAA